MTFRPARRAIGPARTSTGATRSASPLGGSRRGGSRWRRARPAAEDGEARDRGRRGHRRALLRLRTDGARPRRHGARGLGPPGRPRQDHPRPAPGRALRRRRGRALHQARLRAVLEVRREVRPPRRPLPAPDRHAPADRRHLVHRGAAPGAEGPPLVRVQRQGDRLHRPPRLDGAAAPLPRAVPRRDRGRVPAVRGRARPARRDHGRRAAREGRRVGRRHPLQRPAPRRRHAGRPQRRGLGPVPRLAGGDRQAPGPARLQARGLPAQGRQPAHDRHVRREARRARPPGLPDHRDRARRLVGDRPLPRVRRAGEARGRVPRLLHPAGDPEERSPSRPPGPRRRSS